MTFAFLKREPLSWPDGISQFIFSVADALLELGHRVVCITTEDTELDTVADRFQFRRYPLVETLRRAPAGCAASKWGGRYFWRCGKLWLRRGRTSMDRHGPDLIVLNGALPLRFRQPSALLAHDLEPKKSFLGSAGRRLVKAASYRLVRKVLVTCPELVEPVARDCFLSAGRLQVIPTCVDLAPYVPRPLTQRTAIILHVGMQPYKQPQKTLQAFCQMRSQQAKLVVVGKPAPGFQKQVSALAPELRRRIELPGLVPAATLKDLLASARLVSVPSFYHNPVASPTVLESLASHTPVLASRSISALLARDGENCFVENEPEAMARRFDLLLQDDALWARLSDGCARTKHRFDSKTVAKEYVRLAEELAEP